MNVRSGYHCCVLLWVFSNVVKKRELISECDTSNFANEFLTELKTPDERSGI